MENKNFLAEIANLDRQAENAIIDLFNQYKVDSVNVKGYGWVAVDCDFSSFDIESIAIINGGVAIFNPFGGSYDIDELFGSEMSRLYHLLEDEMDNLVEVDNEEIEDIEDITYLSDKKILALTILGLDWLEKNVTPNMGTAQDVAFGGIPALKTTICDILRK